MPSASPDDVVVLGVIIVVVALSVGATVSFFTRDIRLKRRLRRMRPETVAAAREGRLVKLVGRIAEAGPQLSAPITGRACVYFHVWYEVRRTVYVQGARVEEWGPGPEQTDACDFLVTDATGTALVRVHDGGGPEVALRAGAYVHLVSEDGAQRTHEAVLEAGQIVAVFGFTRRELEAGAETGGYRDAPTRLVLAGSAQARIVVSDDPVVIG